MSYQAARASVFLFCSVACLTPAVAQDLPSLLSRFQSEHDRATKELILNRISTEYPDAGPALLKIASKTDDTETKWLAIRGIGWVKFKHAAPFLKKALFSKEIYIRSNSARSLGEIHDISAVPDLISTLKTEQDSGVIEQTALALQMLDATEAVPVLKTRATNPSPDVRLWILGAIETLDSEKDVRFFANFLFDENEFVAARAAHRVERFTGQDFGFPKCGPGPCSFGEGVKNARRWWKDNGRTWKQ
jgi:HEAT repeat protein